MKNIAIILGLILLGVGIWFIFGSISPSTLNDLDGIKVETDDELTFVTVENVMLNQPGYVVLREYVDGQIAQIIEVSDYLKAGTHQDIHIDVSFLGVDFDSSVTVLQADGGEGGFSAITSPVLMMDNNQPAAKMLKDNSLVPVSAFEVLLGNGSDPNKEIAQTVSYTDSGFVPETIEINQGDTVRFVNNSSVGMWVASDSHPAHDILSTFDQFGIGESGESYDYTFNRVGSWDYHDHIDASKLGTVIVK